MSHNAAARAALKAMADAIGDRDGLSTLKEVFGAMDADGSGEIEIDEFLAGLEHFGATNLAEEGGAVSPAGPISGSISGLGAGEVCHPAGLLHEHPVRQVHVPLVDQ